VSFEAGSRNSCLATQHNEDLRDTLVECTEVEGLSLNPVPEILGVTDISNEACESVSVGVKAKTGFIVPSTGYQDLLGYLARPRLIVSGALSTSRGPQNILDLSRTNLLTLWFPDLITRLAGVHGIRFTTRFTLMVASTPFQASVLCQSFQYGTASYVAGQYTRANNSAYVTNLPHVKHDISETTMSVLEVPFLYPQDFMPLYAPVGSETATSAGCIGVYGLNVLMPYRALAGANAPTYKLLISLHDVELIGSMPLASSTVFLQSGLEDARAVYSGAKTLYDKARGQKPKPRGNAILAEEKTIKGSDIARKAASVVRTVAPYVPLLNSVGPLTAGLLDAGANVASYFGFAKPTVEEAPTRVFRNAHIGEANVDMDSASYVLAPFQNNRLAVDALAGGTDVDEMAIQYVIGKYGQAFVGTFATTDTTGTVLYGANICPTSFWFRTNALRPSGNIALPAGSTAVTNSIACTPLCYAASFFRFWRGTLKFKFTFSKTKFHGGRVIAAYVPTLKQPGAAGIASAVIPVLETVAGLPQPFSYSEVFDLKDASSFEFEVPYVCPDPFLEVIASHGAISLTVLDPLVTSGETSTTIDYMVEVKALDDFMFGCPASPMFGILDPTIPGNIVALQSGLGGVSDIDDTVSQYTMGEQILSFKSLMMIPNFVAADLPAVTTSITTALPYWFTNYISAIVPLPTTTSVVGGFTRAANIAAMYAFCTGSTEHHLYSHSGSNANVTLSMQTYNTDSGATASSLGDPRRRGLGCMQRVQTNDNFLHVRVPSYQKYARIPFHEGNDISNAGALGLNISLAACTSLRNSARVVVNNASSGPVRLVYGRAAADDARCMSYIGPPPVALLQGTQTAEPDAQAILF
jgi:hypothetical protein